MLQNAHLLKTKDLESVHYILINRSSKHIQNAIILETILYETFVINKSLKLEVIDAIDLSNLKFVLKS